MKPNELKPVIKSHFTPEAFEPLLSQAYLIFHRDLIDPSVLDNMCELYAGILSRHFSTRAEIYSDEVNIFLNHCDDNDLKIASSALLTEMDKFPTPSDVIYHLGCLRIKQKEEWELRKDESYLARKLKEWHQSESQSSAA